MASATAPAPIPIFTRYSIRCRHDQKHLEYYSKSYKGRTIQRSRCSICHQTFREKESESIRFTRIESQYDWKFQLSDPALVSDIMMKVFRAKAPKKLSSYRKLMEL